MVRRPYLGSEILQIWPSYLLSIWYNRMVVGSPGNKNCARLCRRNSGLIDKHHCSLRPFLLQRAEEQARLSVETYSLMSCMPLKEVETLIYKMPPEVHGSSNSTPAKARWICSGSHQPPLRLSWLKGMSLLPVLRRVSKGTVTGGPIKAGSGLRNAAIVTMTHARHADVAIAPIVLRSTCLPCSLLHDFLDENESFLHVRG